ncbi:MAG TPA: hypothetical protein VGI76_10135 [Solirubrobacteraceae bacterium]
MRGGTTARARIAVGVAAPLLLIGALCRPLLLSDATFNEDWLNHLWYVWHQSVALREGHLPSLFLDYASGVFYPLYAFYGGTLYAATGVLSLVLGNKPLGAYVLTFVLAFAAAYGGWCWLARTFGVRGWPAHIPGIVFVTAAPYLTMLYGLGDWPEFMAVSTMPLLIASALCVLRAERLRFWPALALAASGVLFFGSHLLTVIWGIALLALATAATLLCIPAARRSVTPSAVGRVVAILLPAGLVSAWFLLPTLAYESHTVIAHNYPHFRHVLRSTMYTVAARHLFTLSRARDSGTVLTLALPVLAIAWITGAIAILALTRRRGTWMRVLLLAATVTSLLLVLMTHAGAILALPRIFATLQFAFRLESFVLVGVSGTLLAALVLIQQGEGRTEGWHRLLLPWRWLLILVALASVLGALEQVGAHDRLRPRRAALASYATPTFEREGLLNYVDDELPILRKPLPRVRFAPGRVPGERLVASVPATAGRRVDSNLRAGPDFVRLEGARIVGTDAQANDVLEFTAHNPPARVAVSAADSFPIVAGRLLSWAALVVLAATLCAVGFRDARRGRGHQVRADGSAPPRQLWSALNDRPQRQANPYR